MEAHVEVAHLPLTNVSVAIALATGKWNFQVLSSHARDDAKFWLNWQNTTFKPEVMACCWLTVPLWTLIYFLMRRLSLITGNSIQSGIQTPISCVLCALSQCVCVFVVFQSIQIVCVPNLPSWQVKAMCWAFNPRCVLPFHSDFVPFACLFHFISFQVWFELSSPNQCQSKPIWNHSRASSHFHPFPIHP